MRILITASLLVIGTVFANDVDFFAPRTAPFDDLDSIKWNGTVKSTGRPFVAYMASVEDASLFSIALPPGGCQTRHNTSVAAEMFDCQAATNAGFFSFGGSCVGNSIVDSKVIAWESPGNPAFGLLPNNTVVVGYV